MLRVLLALCVLLPSAVIAEVDTSPRVGRTARSKRRRKKRIKKVTPPPPVEEATPAEAPPPEPPPKTGTALMDELHAKRLDSAAEKEEMQLLADALKESPDDVELLWRQARLNVWRADAMGQGETKKNLGKATWALGDKLIKLAPQRVEGHYYGALGVGQYSQGVGILNALAEGLEGKFNDRLDKAIKLDSGYESGGPLMTKARYFYELPWPMQNLDKSADWYNKCLSSHSENLRCRAWLGETLLKAGKAKEAMSEVVQVLNGDASYDRAEATRVKAMAKKIQADVAKQLK